MLRSCFAAIVVCGSVNFAHSAETLNLSGDWRFAIDRGDEGARLHWYDNELTGTIRLPGSMAEQNLGDDITTETAWIGDIHNREWYLQPEYRDYIQPDNFKFPFWLTPRKHYVGAAWYQRDFEIDPSNANTPMHLTLERAHWGTTAWLDGKPLGSQDSLSTPHGYDFPAMSVGKHRLTLRVDNRLQAAVGVNAHSVSDHTQTNWNGIVGQIKLEPTPGIHVTNLQAYPEPDGSSVRVLATIKGSTALGSSTTLEVVCSSRESKKIIGTISPAVDAASTAPVALRIPITAPIQPWDEFDPALYSITAKVSTTAPGQPNISSVRDATFGFRDFRTSGTQFTINGRLAFLRGTLECCIFPKTGYPPTDVDAWRRILRIARAHGLNHLRFHSWCPPEAAFEAADEMGFYYSIECASWTAPGDDPHYEQWLYAESERIVQAYGNHPSFCMMLYGNEPAGKKRNAFLGKFVDYWKARDSRRLYTSGAGWPMIAQNEFHITLTPRIHRGGKALAARINALPPETQTDYSTFIGKQTVPVVSHEIGQWCVFPNLDERAKYTGVLRALNFDIIADSLEKHHLLDQAHQFLLASGKLQVLCYKEEIESALRTPGMGGFELLDLHDFPGQGTALVGVLDPFWDEKGYISADEYHRFACETVPLARLSKRVWTTDEVLTASIEVTHYGRAPLHDALTSFSLTDEHGTILYCGKVVANVPLGSANPITDIHLPLARCAAPQKLTLTAEVVSERIYSNSWEVWVYPTAVETTAPADLLVTRHLDKVAEETLQRGGKVLFMPERGAIKGGARGPVAAGFSSIFWNTAWFPPQEPVTLGLLCDPADPLWARFPTEGHTNWQWWYILNRSQCMVLDGLPPSIRPKLQMIDDWATNRRLGLIFEAEYHGGKLLVCGADLDSDLDADPPARQLRISLFNYMSSTSFAPKETLTPEELASVVELEKGAVLPAP